MKITRKELYNSTVALGRLAQADLPILTAYNINKNIIEVEKHTELVHQLRKSLFEKYGVTDKQQNISIPPEKVTEFLKQEAELLSQQVEIEVTKIKIPEIIS